jgi:hypothetical protein
MSDLIAKRTLVKSPPELWSELSEVDRLARHLDAFGEIKITKLEPEHTVAWEGEGASGTVSIEPSGWGTKVTLTAQLPAGEEAEAEAPQARATAVKEAVAEEAVVEEMAVEETVVEEAVIEEVVAEETVAVAHDATVEEPAVSQAAEPPQASRRRKRGFLTWLFRPRTGAQLEAEQAEMEPAMREAEEPVTAEPRAAEAEPEPVEAEPEQVEAEPEPVEAAEAAEPVEAAEPEPLPEPRAVTNGGLDPQHAQAVLDEVLDTLGAAHHRPFSRG